MKDFSEYYYHICDDYMLAEINNLLIYIYIYIYIYLYIYMYYVIVTVYML